MAAKASAAAVVRVRDAAQIRETLYTKKKTKKAKMLEGNNNSR
jgi:hypothetical protein